MSVAARRLALVCALALPICTVGAGTAAAAPPAEEFFGANTQSVIWRGYFPQSAWGGFFQTMAGMKLRTARADAYWSRIERTAPSGGVHSYDWSQIDAGVEGMAGAGLRWFPVAVHAPSWAGGTKGIELAADHYDDYVAFIIALARRYGANGDFWRERPGLRYLPVLQYGIWSEPNSPHFWNKNDHSPAEYMRVYQMARSAVAGVDPAAQAVFSLGWLDFEAYTRAALHGGGPVDAVGFAPYGVTAKSALELMRKLRLLLRSLGRGGTPVYAIEYGRPSNRLGDARWPSDSHRAATVSLTAEALSRSDCNVGSFLVYSLVEGQNNPSDFEQSMGILDANGSLTLTGAAYRDAAASHRPGAASGPLPLCASADNPRAQLLPLELKVTKRPGDCFEGTVRYRGHPLEDANVHYTTARRRGKVEAGDVTTNTAGDGSFCLRNAARRGGTARAEVERVASSAVVHLDDIRPRVRRFSLSGRGVTIARRGGSGRAAARRRGKRTVFRYRLSERANVRISIRRIGRTRRKRRGARVSGELRQSARAGRNSLRFRGRIRGRPLLPGRYRAVITAVDPAGNRSRRRATRFRVRWR